MESTDNVANCPVEFRIMLTGDNDYIWRVIIQGSGVVARGVAETEPEACQQANDAARNANVIE